MWQVEEEEVLEHVCAGKLVSLARIMKIILSHTVPKVSTRMKDLVRT